MLLSCLKILQCIAFFCIVQCVFYLLLFYWNRDFRRLSIGAVEGFLCQPPLSVQKLCIPQPLQPCWSSSFQHSEKRELERLFSLILLWFGKPFAFPASYFVSRCWSSGLHQKVQAKLSVCQDECKANIVFNRLCCTSSQFYESFETFKIISGSCQFTMWH